MTAQGCVVWLGACDGDRVRGACATRVIRFSNLIRRVRQADCARDRLHRKGSRKRGSDKRLRSELNVLVERGRDGARDRGRLRTAMVIRVRIFSERS